MYIMKRNSSICLIIILFLCALQTAALAAGADAVWINNYKLDSSAQYWKNNGTVGTPSDFNAYFDAVTSTLTLDAANLTSLYTAPSGDSALVYADGELTVILKNDSSLTCHGTSIYDIRGIWATSTLTLTGTGTANIDLQNDAADRGFAMGIVSGYDLNVQNGDYDMDIMATDQATGIFITHDTVISGGQIKVYTSAKDGIAINSQGNVDISGGEIDATGSNTGISVGMFGDEIFLRGGEGLLQAGDAFISCGLMFENNTLHVSGGDFVFSGSNCAMSYGGTDPPSYDLRGIDTFVSEDALGLGRWQWKSKTDGELASSESHSPFRYVQFSEKRSLHGVSASAPQTGDGTRPWLWAGISVACLLCAAGVVLPVRRKRCR
jgi:hypothetical protein